MTPTQYAEATASEVRAEMGRQRKTQAQLATALGITSATAARRLDGSVPFDLIELGLAAEWLGVSPIAFMAERFEVSSVGSAAKSRAAAS